VRVSQTADTLTRLAALATLSRDAGEGEFFDAGILNPIRIVPISTIIYRNRNCVMGLDIPVSSSVIELIRR
jgi:hypothetical protein